MTSTTELQLAHVSIDQTSLQNGQFLSRIFTDVSGRSFRLTFFVSISGGEVKGTLISAEPMSGRGLGKMSVFFLPCPKVDIPISSLAIVSPYIQVSPYYSLDFLLYSQPTRAPSLF